MPDVFQVTLVFETAGDVTEEWPADHPTPAQFEALFDRLDEAVVRATMVLEWPDLEADRAAAPALRDWARRAMERRVDEVPRVVEVLYDAPVRIKLILKGLKSTAAVLLAIGAVFQAGQFAVDRATGLVTDIDQLTEAVEAIGQSDERAERSGVQLNPEQGSPKIRLKDIQVERW